MTAKLNGGVALGEFLASLPEKLERNILRGALKAGAEEYAEGARENCRSEEVRDTIKVSSRAEPGIVSAKVQTKGPGAFKAPWLEHGTDPHFISVDDAQSGGRTVRRVNTQVKDGKMTADSLKIGGKFVGSTVFHPGAKPYPFFRPAVDTREGAAIAAISNHISTKLSKEGLNSPPLPDEPEE